MTLRIPFETDSRAGWEWGLVAVLVVNLFWTTLCLGGFLAETVAVTTVLNGMLLMLFLLERMLGARSRLHRASGWLLPFLCYAAVNAAWITPVPWLGWRDWLNWAQIVLVFVVVLNGVRTPRARAFLFMALVVLASIEVLLAIYQRYENHEWLMLGRTQAVQFMGRSSGSFGAPNSLAAFLILLIPATAGRCVRPQAGVASRIAWGYLTLVLSFALVLTISRGAWLALGVVAAMSPLFLAMTKPTRRLGAAALSSVAVLIVLATVYAAMPAARERIGQLKANAGELSRPIMWQAGWRIFLDQPIAGGGAGSYDALFDRHRPEGFQLRAHWAHNEYLNTLSDYGLLGSVLLWGACAAIAMTCWRRRSGACAQEKLGPDFFAAGLGAGIVAFMLQLVVDFGLKIPALGLALAIVSALWVGRRWPAPIEADSMRPGRGRRLAGTLGLIGLGIAIVGWVFPLYRGEALRQKARARIDQLATSGSPAQQSVIVETRRELREATQFSSSNGDAWADLSYVTSLLVQFDSKRAEELGREAERAADAALARSKVVADFWVRRSVALDLQGRWIEAGADMIRALELAPTRANLWYQQAAHLGLQPVENERALAAVAVSLRLDPGNPEAHALRRRLADRIRAP